MATKAGDIVNAYCSHCKVNGEAVVAAAVGDEVVTVTCKTCGTSQRYLAEQLERGGAEGKLPKRRVIDVAPRRHNKQRSRSRRVVSTTGRAIPDVPLPGARPTPPAKPTTPAPRRDEALFARWDEATDQVDARYARPHREHEAYDPGEAILHKIHGMGIVDSVAEDGDVKVLFKDGFVELPAVPRPPPSPARDEGGDEHEDEGA